MPFVRVHRKSSAGMQKMRLAKGEMARRRNPKNRGGDIGDVPLRANRAHGPRRNEAARQLPQNTRRLPPRQARHTRRHANDSQGARLPPRDARRDNRRRHKPAHARLSRGGKDIPADSASRGARRQGRGKRGGCRADNDTRVRADTIRKAGRYGVVFGGGARKPRRIRLSAFHAAHTAHIPLKERGKARILRRKMGR